MDQSKTDEGLLNLVEDLQREKEEHQEKITQLENLLEEKEGEIEGLRAWGQILKLKERKNDQEIYQLRVKLNNRPKQEIDMILIDDELNEAPKKSIHKFHTTLIGDELNEARNALINGLTNMPKRDNIGIKRMGELYFNPFFRAMKSKYIDTEAEIKALEAWSLWKEYIRDPDWYPFEVIGVNGKEQLIINNDNEKLKALREELGDEVHETVTRALIEIKENKSDIMIPELWNFSEGKKATLKEGILAILANRMGIVDELKSAHNLAINLAKQLDMKNKMICELEHKRDNFTAEKDRLQRSFSEEMRKMELMALRNKKLQHELEIQTRKADLSSRENDKLKQESINQMQILEERTKEFDNKIFEIKHEATSLHIEKETLETKNCDGGDHKLAIQIENLKKELSDKIEDLQFLENLNQDLITKGTICNDELQDARKEAIQVFRKTLNQRTSLRIKGMGEVDLKPFRDLFLGKNLNGENIDEISTKLCSSWQKEVQNSQWQPFKKVVINGKLTEIVDENDNQLKKLRNEHGEEAYKAVANALLELNEYNPSGRYIEAEIWYAKENRKATMKEVLQYLFSKCGQNKLKRKRS